MQDMILQLAISFQPTPSARRVTVTIPITLTRARLFQPTPSARRVTGVDEYGAFYELISTHTLRKEGDSVQLCNRRVPRMISTHTLRKEGDVVVAVVVLRLGHFNPHPPQGG